MKKVLKKAIVLSLAAAMVFSAVGCKKKSPSDLTNTPTPTQGGSETPAPGGDEKATYTYNLTTGASPTNWNTHTWENNGDRQLMDFSEMGLVDSTIAADGVNFEWAYEMADAITDITASFADKDKYGITEDTGRVFQIDLNQAAKWADGTPINADTYVYSMQKQLDPEMKNYRSNSYTSGQTAIYNAAKYFLNDKAGTPIYADIFDGEGYVVAVADTDKMFVSLTAPNAFFGSSLEEAYKNANYTPKFTVDEVDHYAALEALVGEEEFVAVNDEILTHVKAISNSFGSGYDEEFTELLFYNTGENYKETPWEDVGLVKTGDYQIIYITETPVTMFYFLSNATSNWIVHEKLYEAGMEQRGKLKATNYGTSVETYMSYGPYKLVNFEVDKQYILERNENWYGYTDGKHEGQYQTTTVKVDIIADHNTELQLFNSGAIDEVSLTADDMTTYRMSDNLLKTDQTYTFRWIFNSDINALKALEELAGDGANKRVLSYKDFRKAISLSMDRTRLVTEGTAGFKPAYFLLNYLYYTDIENNTESQYRNTTEAKEAVLRLYGITYGEGTAYATIDDAFASVTGYDVEEAKALFQSVYEKAIADGNYTDGQKVLIRGMVSAAAALTAEDIAQQELMNDFVTAATVGTGFEGKIEFKFEAGATKRYDDVVAGKVEMIRGAWGGAAFYPFSTIRVYTEPDYMGGLAKIHESGGWNPTMEKLEIVYDFNGDGTAETVTKTIQDWAKSINGGGEFYGDAQKSLVILSYLETAVLSAYQAIPWGTDATVSLYSKQIEYATLDYNIMYSYGGVRLMKYNYSDAEWDAYVASQGGTLSYE